MDSNNAHKLKTKYAIGFSNQPLISFHWFLCHIQRRSVYALHLKLSFTCGEYYASFFFRTKTEIFNGQITMQLQNFLADLNGTRAPIYIILVHIFKTEQMWMVDFANAIIFLVFCLRNWYKTFEKFTRRKFRPVTSSWKLLVLLHAAILESCHANNNPV